MRFELLVLDGQARPVVGKQVAVSFTGFDRCFVVTDHEGRAVFRDDTMDVARAIICVEGEKHGPWDIQDGDSYIVSTR